MSAKKEILTLLIEHYPNYIHKGRIFELLSDLSYLPDTLSRQLRLLASNGQIERHKRGKSVEYRWIPTEPENLTEETRRAFQQVAPKQDTLL